jgi:hypothetical protein
VKAFVIVKGQTDVEILKALLPHEIVDSISTVTAGERSNLTSVARTLLVTQHKPVAILVKAESQDETLIQQQRQTTEDLVKAVSGKVPVKVILLVPEIEIVFFQAPRVIERVFGPALPDELVILARDNPKAALSQLFARKMPGPHNLRAVLDRLDDEDIESLRSTPPIRELITFLTETANRPPQKAML